MSNYPNKIHNVHESYINQFVKTKSGKRYKKYNPDSTLAVGFSENGLEVRVILSPKVSEQSLENLTLESFLEENKLPAEYKGFKVNYRIMKMLKAR